MSTIFKILLPITLSLSISAIASAQTPAECQRIHQMADEAYRETAATGIDKDPYSPVAQRKEEKALEKGRALANYMLRVCANKQPARDLLKQIAAEENAIARCRHEQETSRRTSNVVVSIINVPEWHYNPDTGYHPPRVIGRYEPDFFGRGGTFYDK
jgi:hypothetical protein